MICMAALSCSVVVRIRQQRKETRPVDRRVQLPLVVRLGSRQPRRNDLAVFGNEVAQRVDILVVDLLDALGREAAELLALEQRILLIGPARRALALALAFSFAAKS